MKTKMFQTLLLLATTLASFSSYAENLGPVKVNLIASKGFSVKERETLNKAVVIFETVINSEEFKQEILNYTYQKKPHFVNNNGQTNEQIFATIMAGKETFTEQADSVADFDLTIYNSGWTGRNVVGYTNPGTSKIFMNRRFYSTFEPYEIAGNMAHEWCHKLGYDHDYKRTARRAYSIPYAVGDIVVELGAKLVK